MSPRDMSDLAALLLEQRMLVVTDSSCFLGSTYGNDPEKPFMADFPKNHKFETLTVNAELETVARSRGTVAEEMMVKGGANLRELVHLLIFHLIHRGQKHVKDSAIDEITDETILSLPDGPQTHVIVCPFHNDPISQVPKSGKRTYYQCDASLDDIHSKIAPSIARLQLLR